ncbi:MAG TPA: F0F1 ATP synthase subunit delta [Nocardioides sp.]|nr:F0F1 ATP synthase subunit delta [Nocardioides sp.]
MQGTRGTRWRGSSAESLRATLDQLDTALAGGANGAETGADLFVAADLLREQPALRRAATDPRIAAEIKTELVREVFGPHLGRPAVDVLATAVTHRWAAGQDLPDALAHVAVVSDVTAADAAGDGDQLEENLFRFSRVVADHPELRDALSDPRRSVDEKQGLVRDLVEGKVAPAALTLLQRAVTSTHLTVASALEDFIEITSATRGRRVARVWSAGPLNDAETDRLAAALGRIYGGTVHVNVIEDADVLGGLRIEIGDEVIDGTVRARLDDARRRLAG